MDPMADSIETIFADPRLDEPLQRWSVFVHQVSVGDHVGVVYHGDLDGAIGAAYGRRVLQAQVANLKVSPYWVATEEFDFEALISWLTQQRLGRCAFFDISIENHGTTIEALDRLVADSVFIFDHHVVTSRDVPDKIVVANPTPAKLNHGQRHVPTFMFAMAIAKQENLSFPDWLALLALFAEGVEFQYQAVAKRLFATCLGIDVSRSLRDAYRRSILSRISSLVRADFSGTEKQHRTLGALDDVSAGKIATLEEFHESLEDLLGAEASAISTEISREVSSWERKIRVAPADQKLIVIPLESEHSVSGPVASILRGKFPERVIAAYAIHGSTAVFEFRTANDSDLDFPALLHSVNEDVPLKNFGGHPSAAGASLSVDQIDDFLACFHRRLASVQ